VGFLAYSGALVGFLAYSGALVVFLAMFYILYIIFKNTFSKVRNG
jgi:hypothetical protein